MGEIPDPLGSSAAGASPPLTIVTPELTARMALMAGMASRAYASGSGAGSQKIERFGSFHSW